MRKEEKTQADPAIQNAITKLQAVIQHHYPQASFTLVQGDDPEGIYLRVFVAVADVDEVIDVFIDQLFYFQIEEQLPLYVVPVRPLNKVLEATQMQMSRLPHHGGEYPPL